MDSIPANTQLSTGIPRSIKFGLWSVLGLLVAGATYLYSVRGVAMILDLSSGIAGMLCL